MWMTSQYQLQRNEPHSRDGDHRGSELDGWLAGEWAFHVSKDEEGVEGKSVVLVSNASLKAALTSSTKALRMRVVSHARILGVDADGAGAARQRRTQCARLTKIK